MVDVDDGGFVSTSVRQVIASSFAVACEYQEPLLNYSIKYRKNIDFFYICARDIIVWKSIMMQFQVN